MNDPAQESAFLGRGWSFPPAFDRFSRGVEMVQGEKDIEQSLRLIFGITPGQRQMLPQFGCDLAQFLFQPLDTSLETMIETVVSRALLDYEPRINVNGVTVTQGDDITRQEILIAVTYTVRSTNRRYNLVYPYYLNEATGIPG